MHKIVYINKKSFWFLSVLGNKWRKSDFYLWEENHWGAEQGGYGFCSGINLSIIFAFDLLLKSLTLASETTQEEKNNWKSGTKKTVVVPRMWVREWMNSMMHISHVCPQGSGDLPWSNVEPWHDLQSGVSKPRPTGLNSTRFFCPPWQETILGVLSVTTWCGRKPDWIVTHEVWVVFQLVLPTATGFTSVWLVSFFFLF